MESGCYVYGVVKAGALLPEGASGVAGAPLRSVTGGRVAAVVADVSLHRRGLRADLLAHSQVLDSLAACGEVVPVRFGSMLPDDRSVIEDLLLPKEQQFMSYLEEFRGRSQFNLRATYHQDAALAEVVRADPEIAELRRQARALGEQQGYAIRVRLGELVARALDDKRASDTAMLLDAVVPFVAAHAVRQGGGVDHLTEVALLVDDDRREDFEQQLEMWAEAVHERIRLQLMGPMAPYDFVEG